MSKPIVLTEGSVSLTVPADLPLPDKAGKLSPDELARFPRSRKGLGLACQATAVALTKKGAEFTVPGVDAAALAVAGDRAEKIDEVIEDVRTLLAKLEQANVLIDVEAIDLLRKVSAQVNAQGKFDENLFERFSAVGTYFGKK